MLYLFTQLWCSISTFTQKQTTGLQDPLLETDFVEKHQGHGLDRVVTTIYVVPQEQIVGPWVADKKTKK